MPRLSPGQLAKAERLQKAGQTLREIAGELGVGFEAVCLGLYGGNAGWGPRAEAPPAAADQPAAEAVAEVRTPVAEVQSRVAMAEAQSVGSQHRAVLETSPQQRAAVAPTQAFGSAFRLADELGQWLSRDGQKMTRDISRAWRGNTAQVAVIQKRHPHLRQLILEPVEDA